MNDNRIMPASLPGLYEKFGKEPVSGVLVSDVYACGLGIALLEKGLTTLEIANRGYTEAHEEYGTAYADTYWLHFDMAWRYLNWGVESSSREGNIISALHCPSDMSEREKIAHMDGWNGALHVWDVLNREEPSELGNEARVTVNEAMVLSDQKVLQAI